MKNIKITLSLLFLLLMIITTLQLSYGAEAGGIVYYIEGGTGRGLVHLYGNGKLLRIVLPDTYKEIGFPPGTNGYRYGAQWQVTYHKSGKELILDKVVFNGKFNDTVREADELIRLHYAQLADGDYEAAYANLSPEWHESQSFNSFVKGFKKTDFNEYASDPPTYALKVIGHNSKLVLILVDTHYFFKNSGSYLRFEVVKINDQWFIDRADPITYKDWEKS